MSKVGQYALLGPFERIPSNHLASIVNAIHHVLLVISFPMGFASVSRVPFMGWNAVIIYHVLVWALIMVSWLYRKRISYQGKSWLFILGLCGMAFLGVYSLGFLSSGVLYLVLAVVFASIFFTPVHGFFILVIGLSGYSLLAYMHINHMLMSSFDVQKYIFAPTSWFMEGGVLAIITSSIIIINYHYQLQLRKSQISYSTLFECATDGILILETGIITKCNHKACKLYGASVHTLTKSHLFDWAPEYQPTGQRSAEVWNEIEQRVLGGENQEFEWVQKRADGNLFHAEVHVNAVNVRNERVLQAIITDVSEKIASLHAIKTSEEKYRLLADNIHDVIWKMNIQTNQMVYISPSIYQLRGYTVEEALQEPFEAKVLPEYVSVIKNSLEEKYQLYLKGDFPNTKECLIVQQPCKNGEVKWVELKTSFIVDVDNKPIEVVGVSRDVTHRRELEKKLVLATMRAEEGTRERLAKELHDGVGPLLSVAKIHLHTLINTDDPIRRDQISNQFHRLLDDSLQAIKEISVNISPHVITHFGLKVAIVEFIDKVKVCSPVDIVFRANEMERLDPVYELALYRIAEELISNTLKHANASVLALYLQYNSPALELQYFDDGVGVDLSNESVLQGNGLKNIAARVKSLNGICNFTSSINAGFNAVIKLDV